MLARLLRMRLLRLDAEVVIMPAEVTTASTPPPRSYNGPPARSTGLPPRSRPTRGGLAEAVRQIDEGEALLAEARRRGLRR